MVTGYQQYQTETTAEKEKEMIYDTINTVIFLRGGHLLQVFFPNGRARVRWVDYVVKNGTSTPRANWKEVVQ